MTWISIIRRESAGERLKALYDRLAGPGGQIDNILLAHGLRPHTLEGHMALPVKLPADAGVPVFAELRIPSVSCILAVTKTCSRPGERPRRLGLGRCSDDAAGPPRRIAHPGRR